MVEFLYEGYVFFAETEEQHEEMYEASKVAYTNVLIDLESEETLCNFGSWWGIHGVQSRVPDRMVKLVRILPILIAKRNGNK